MKSVTIKDNNGKLLIYVIHRKNGQIEVEQRDEAEGLKVEVRGVGATSMKSVTIKDEDGKLLIYVIHRKNGQIEVEQRDEAEGLKVEVRNWELLR